MLGEYQLNGSLLKVFNHSKVVLFLPKPEKKPQDQNTHLINLLIKILLSEKNLSPLYFFLCEEMDVPILDELRKK